MAALPTITSGAGALTGLLFAVPQFAAISKAVGYQPQNVLGTNQTPFAAPALVFNYEGEQTAQLQSDVTDHYVEDNTTIQDQVALKPTIITTHGYIGELNDLPPTGLFGNSPLAAAVGGTAQLGASKLSMISSYAPGLSVAALQAYNEAFFAYQIATNARNAAVSAYGTIANGYQGASVISGNSITAVPNQNKQQLAFQQFFGYFSSRTLFTVQTPWAVFQNMVILGLRAIQDADTAVITDFEVSFKQIRFASTAKTTGTGPDNSHFAGRLAAQGADTVNLGNSTPSLAPGNFTDKF